MILSEIVQGVCDDANVRSSTTEVEARIIRRINRVCSDLWDGYRWSFRWRNQRIVTDVDVTAGTVSLTNGSQTVTGSGTSFLSTYIGWHIYFPGDSIPNWYKIIHRSSATGATLDVPYQGTSGSSKTYILRHFDYILPTEQWDLGSLIATADNRPLGVKDPSSLEVLSPMPTYRGYPFAVSIIGSDTIETNYTTGTVTGTVDTNVLVGSGTAWLTNVYPGDTITIGSYTYTVYRVVSDTAIVLHNFLQLAASGATYTAKRQNGRLLRILWPSDNNYTIDIRALRKYAPLVHDSDTNELIYRYPDMVIKRVASAELRGQNDKRASELFNESNLAVLMAKAEDDSLTPKEQTAPLSTYRDTNRAREVFR